MYAVQNEVIIRGPGRAAVYPYATMEVGEVFYIPFKDGRRQFHKAYASRRYWQKKFPNREWDIHAVSVGLRVQRVK